VQINGAKRRLRNLLALLLVLVMLTGAIPIMSLAQPLQRFEFLNPLGPLVPRQDIPLASREGVREILAGNAGHLPEGSMTRLTHGTADAARQGDFVTVPDGDVTYVNNEPIAPTTVPGFGALPDGAELRRGFVQLGPNAEVTEVYIVYVPASRELRLGIAAYRKSLDGDMAMALGEMLRGYWEEASRNPARTDIPEGLRVRLVYNPPRFSHHVPGIHFDVGMTTQITEETFGEGVPNRAGTDGMNVGFDTMYYFGRPYYHFIPHIGFPWNPRADHVYDQWADRADAMIMATGD